MAGRRSSKPAHGFSRSDRIAEQLRRELADLLRFEVKDPRLSPYLGLITLTDIEVSPDYTHAKVFYTVMGIAEEKPEIAQGLNRLAGFLRRELGTRIRIHHIPQLHFAYDSSIERGSRLSSLIDAAVAESVLTDSSEE